MSDLLSLLSLGSNGIAAQNTGIAVATNNVANVNTAGYSRQRVDLESLLAAPLVGGVRSGSPDRMQDYLLSGRIRTAAGSLAMSTAFSQAVLDIETRLTGDGDTVHEQLGTLASRINELTAAPTDPVSRDAVVAAARDLVAGIRRRAAELAAARQEANIRIRDNAANATSLAQQLADANKSIASSNDPVMRDERDRLATQLSQITGGTARIDPDGQMRFVLDGGAVLVDGAHASQMTTTPDPTTSDLRVQVVSGSIKRDVTGDIGTGSMGADLHVRDGVIDKAQSQLDQLAVDIATSYNSVHQANAGLDGVSGRPMFVAPTQLAGAAKTIAIDPALDQDSKLLATAKPGAGPGDNTGALALAGLAQAPIAAGGKKLADSALDIVSAVGVAAAQSNNNVKRDKLVADNLAGLRDSLAGVDIEEEMTNLARFEHATQAMTRFVSTVDEMLGDLISKL